MRLVPDRAEDLPRRRHRRVDVARLWASETNAASNCDGRQVDAALEHARGRSGRSARCRDVLARRVVGDRAPSVKKSVSIEPTRLTRDRHAGRRAPRAQARRRGARRAARAARRCRVARGARASRARRPSPAGCRRACPPGRRARAARSCSMMSRAPAVGADRQAAADDLAEAREVGRDAVAAPARRRSATRKPVITSSKISSAPCCARERRAGPARKPRRGGTQPMLPATGSTMTAAISRRARANSRLDRGEVVERRDERVGARRRRARRRESGMPSVATPEPACDQQAVGVAVIAAVELDDHVAAGEAAREAQRAHRRLGARLDQAHHLDRRHGVAIALGELDLAARSARRSSCRARAASLTASTTSRVRVAEDQRAPRADVVDVLVAVDVPDVRARGRAR